MIDPVFSPHPTRLIPLACLSRAPHGDSGDEDATAATLSADGRVAAFTSRATNLVHGLHPEMPQVFVRDLESGVIDCVSLSSEGRLPRGPAFDPALSADGRFVAFASPAANLVRGDRNAWCDVFVRDRMCGRTERVSVSSAGAEGNGESTRPTISADGRFVAFTSVATNFAPRVGDEAPHVYVHDRLTHRTRLAGPGDAASLSEDGRRVAFAGGGEVCVRDLVGGSLTRIAAGREPALSADGRQVAFVSGARVLVRDLASGAAVEVAGRGAAPALSADGTRVAYVASPGSASVIEVADPRSGSRIAITAAWDPRERGGMDRPVLSADGRRLVFTSDAPGLRGGPGPRQAYVALLDAAAVATSPPPPRITRGPDSVDLGGVRVPIRKGA